jgi:pimeloyl-ACP methyl ester carboxylesterase
VRWQAWLGSQHPAAVYGFGESLGGAIILQSLAAGAHFTAIVVESPYAYFAQVARERVVKYGRVPPWLAMLLIDEGMLYVRIRHGVDLSAAKPAEAVRASTTPILLIHGLDDQETYPIHSREILRNAVDARLWLVPHAKHTGAYGAAPREFESRVLRALAR